MRQIRFLFSAFFLFIGFDSAFGQSNQQLQSLYDFLLVNNPPVDSTLQYIKYTQGAYLHYLYPFYQLFGEEQKFRELLTDTGYYDELSQAASFVDDYSSALAYQQKTYGADVDEVALRQINKTIQGYKNIQHVDARRFISFIAPRYQVLMINEAHNKPLHRAFLISLLNELYRKGFRYLAMEMLNNYSNHSLEKLTSLTGHYCAEPVAGELVRMALDMGYKLVSYEDTAAVQHTASQRDSIQAENIYKVIQADSSAKIIVYAGYGHIAEKVVDENYIPMAVTFKKISGIDPLTIDQTDMSEISNFAYGKAFYDAYMQKFNLTSSSVALLDDQPINVTNSGLYDISIIHPPTAYQDGRPTWLGLNGRRQPTYIKSSSKNTFLVQAYYQFETFGSRPGLVIPADQTYTRTGKGSYLLYLRRGKYILIFRDFKYRILYTQHIEVS